MERRRMQQTEINFSFFFVFTERLEVVQKSLKRRNETSQKQNDVMELLKYSFI